jgi:hypothetical protein
MIIRDVAHLNREHGIDLLPPLRDNNSHPIAGLR